MKLSCVLSACNLNPAYSDFIPMFITTWEKLYPTVSVKVILISNLLPKKLQQYQSNIILFPLINGVSDVFISQYIRLLYPALLDEFDGGILITDIDMVPLNRNYFTSNIESIENTKFVCYRDNYLNQKKTCLCYCVATSLTWKEIFHVKSVKDVRDRLINVFSTLNHVDEIKSWFKDQTDLYIYMMKWHKKTGGMVALNDSKTGHHRLCRYEHRYLITDKARNDIHTKIGQQKIVQMIKQGIFTDYHCCRPFKKYQKLNKQIVSFTGSISIK